MTIPKNYRRTARLPVEIAGKIFRCYRVGNGRFALISDDGRCFVSRTFSGRRYYALADDAALLGAHGNKRRFNSERAAAEAAVKALT